MKLRSNNTFCILLLILYEVYLGGIAHYYSNSSFHICVHRALKDSKSLRTQSKFVQTSSPQYSCSICITRIFSYFWWAIICKWKLHLKHTCRECLWQDFFSFLLLLVWILFPHLGLTRLLCNDYLFESHPPPTPSRRKTFLIPVLPSLEHVDEVELRTFRLLLVNNFIAYLYPFFIDFFTCVYGLRIRFSTLNLAR